MEAAVLVRYTYFLLKLLSHKKNLCFTGKANGKAGFFR